MKLLFSLLLILFIFPFAFAQQHYLDSLRQKLHNADKEDTFRVKSLCSMADYYGFVQADSCFFYATQAAELSDKLNYEYGRFLSYRSKFFAFNCNGNYPMALEQALNFDRAFEQLKKEGRQSVGTPHYFAGVLYSEMNDYPTAIDMFRQTIETNQKNGLPVSEIFFVYSQLGVIYLSLNCLDSALWYAQFGYDLGLKSKEYKKYFSLAIGVLGLVHGALHHYKQAENLFRYGIQQSGEFNNIYFQARNYYNLASLFNKENSKDSAIYYAGIALQLCLQHNFAEFTLNASRLLTKLYDSSAKTDSVLKYMRIVLAAKDSVFSQSKGQQFRQFAFDEIERQKKITTDEERYRNKVKLYIMLAASLILLITGVILYRNNKQKVKANILLIREKQKVETTLSELKSTQAQLIHSEKMASLGELTAGIAHEIQNPLNFVNNFSEVNKELISELVEEVNKGNAEEVKAIANDIKDNEEKINHHGKRADAIVKGMLQHSRTSAGQKEPADINALAEEYLRLSFLGMRGKEKNLPVGQPVFNPALKTDFDESIGKINIVPQEIGRVLLNLFNNAFYAVNQKSKFTGTGYQPLVSVQTKKVKDRVIITVSDNGNGIPSTIKDKIFQPFFTTKPTGEGTGLGLSLSYDIIKAHGGEIHVESPPAGKDGEGTKFIIELPVA